MAAGIAHDFKNLLSAIISHLSIARLKIENTEADEKLDAAEEAAQASQNTQSAIDAPRRSEKARGQSS